MTTTNTTPIAVIHTDKNHGSIGKIEVFANISDAIRATDTPMYGCYVTMMTADRLLYSSAPGVDCTTKAESVIGAVNVDAVQRTISCFVANA